MSVSRRALRAGFQVRAAALAGRPSFWLLCIVTLFCFPILRSMHAQRDLPHSRPVLGLVRDFELSDQDGELGSAQLRGRIWVASFSAVDREATASEQAMQRMAELRHRTRNLGDAIRLVTFGLDPNRDTATQMSALSVAQRASHGIWRFVSGPPARVNEVTSDFQVTDTTPTTRVALVDGKLQIRGYYDLADEAALGNLLRDVSLLLSLGG